MPIRLARPGIFECDDDVIAINAEQAAMICAEAARSGRRRARLCAHRAESDAVHEMLIALDRGTYVRPHRHTGKTESFHIILGEAAVIVFDDAGKISRVIEMGDYAAGRVFYYRLQNPAFHTVIPRSDMLLLHEVTNGPFQPGAAEFAVWAPDESDARAAAAYLDALHREIAGHA